MDKELFKYFIGNFEDVGKAGGSEKPDNFEKTEITEQELMIIAYEHTPVEDRLEKTHFGNDLYAPYTTDPARVVLEKGELTG